MALLHTCHELCACHHSVTKPMELNLTNILPVIDELKHKAEKGAWTRLGCNRLAAESEQF